MNVGNLQSNKEGLVLLKFLTSTDEIAAIEGPLIITVPNGEDAYGLEATADDVAFGNLLLADPEGNPATFTHGVWNGVHGSGGLGEIVMNVKGDGDIGPGQDYVVIDYSFTSVSEQASHGVSSAMVSTRPKTP